jgi:hypothetical protein
MRRPLKRAREVFERWRIDQTVVDVAAVGTASRTLEMFVRGRGIIRRFGRFDTIVGDRDSFIILPSKLIALAETLAVERSSSGVALVVKIHGCTWKIADYDLIPKLPVN